MAQSMTQHNSIEQSKRSDEKQDNQDIEHSRIFSHLLKFLAVRSKCSICAIKAMQTHTLSIAHTINAPISKSLCRNCFFIIERNKQRRIDRLFHHKDCTIGKVASINVSAFKIGLISRVVKLIATLRHCLNKEIENKEEQQRQHSRQAEPEAASFSLLAFYAEIANIKERREFLIAVNNALAIHDAKAKALPFIRSPNMA